jgi:hypothetical protein
MDMFFDGDTFEVEKDELFVDNVDKEGFVSFLCVEYLFLDPPKQSRP